jgi:hypothetical protein
MLGTLRSDVRVGVEIHALLKDISLIYKFHSRDKKKEQETRTTIECQNTAWTNDLLTQC